jgi:hypothetical protein
VGGVAVGAAVVLVVPAGAAGLVMGAGLGVVGGVHGVLVSSGDDRLRSVYVVVRQSFDAVDALTIYR